MNLLETILFCLLLLIIVFTFIREPAVSMKYYKEAGKTTISGFAWTKDRVVSIFHKDKEVRVNDEP